MFTILSSFIENSSLGIKKHFLSRLTAGASWGNLSLGWVKTWEDWGNRFGGGGIGTNFWRRTGGRASRFFSSDLSFSY